MYGAVNVGDELICRAVAHGLRRRFPGVQPVIATSNVTKSRAFNDMDGVEYVEGGRFHYKFWLNLPRYLRSLERADAVVIGGGGLFQDHYSWRLPMSAAFCALTGKLLGKPVFVIGAGAGPVNRTEVRRSIKEAVDSVDLVCVRDQQSKDVLVDCGVSGDRILVTADVVPSMSIPGDNTENQTEEKKRIAFILREWPGIDKERLARLLDWVVERGYKASLLCFESSNDGAFYSEVVSYCKTDIAKHLSISKPNTVEESIRAVGRASCVVSMRYHGCVLAMMSSRPLIAVEYENKVANLSKELGLQEVLIQTTDLNEDLASKIEETVTDWEKRFNLVQENWKGIRERSERNFEEIEVKWKERSEKKPVLSRLKRYGGPWLKLVEYTIRGEVEHLGKKMKGMVQAFRGGNGCRP